MPQDMKTICLDGTNCYLIKTTAGFILIDTGYPFHRGKLEKGLEQEGCTPGNLELILLTHGDIDHSGNAAYLREKYKANIAMHSGDTEMCLKDGFTRDRGKAPFNFPPLLYLWLIQSAFEFLFGQLFWRKPFDRFEPDLLLEEGRSLAEYGFDAKVLYTPGHSKGSVSVLTGDGNLFCGDMFGNIWGKILKSVDEAGFDRLKALNIKTIYPGHGQAFPMDRLMNN